MLTDGRGFLIRVFSCLLPCVGGEQRSPEAGSPALSPKPKAGPSSPHSKEWKLGTAPNSLASPRPEGSFQFNQVPLPLKDLSASGEAGIGRSQSPKLPGRRSVDERGSRILGGLPGLAFAHSALGRPVSFQEVGDAPGAAVPGEPSARRKTTRSDFSVGYMEQYPM